MKDIFRRLAELILILQWLILTYCEANERNGKNNLVEVCTGTEEDKTRILEIRDDIIKLSGINWKKCFWEPNIIKLFALKEVIIDTDLVWTGKKIQLVIIAPIWKVVINNNEVSIEHGFRIINLSGTSGKEHDVRKALDGNKKGYVNGADGLAGLPGGSAGNFFGVAKKIENGEKLKIFATGGRGGPGQKGGDGSVGADGKLFHSPNACTDILQDISAAKRNGRRLTFSVDFKQYVGKGERGGAAGNGGVGGVGGNKGDIKILKLSGSTKKSVQIYSENGKLGEIGLAGNPGRNGQTDTNLLHLCNHFARYLNLFRDEPKVEVGTGFAGKDGDSLKFQQKAEKLPVQNFASIVNQYKNYIRLSLDKLYPEQEPVLLQFYNDLITHEDIAQLSDTMSLVEEFTDLENQHYSLHKKIDFGPSYKALQTKIENYIENPKKPDENTQEYINVLDDLKIDILNRQDDLKHFISPVKVKTNVQIELKERLSPVVKKLYKLQRFDNILHLLKTRLSPLEKIIGEGQHVIGEKLRRALLDFDDSLNRQVDFLLREIKKLKEKEKENIKELLEQRQKLRHLLLFKVFTGITTASVELLKSSHPVLGFAVSAVTSAIQTIVATEMESQTKIEAVVIPDSIKHLARDNFETDIEKYLNVIKIQETYINQIKEKTSLEEAAAVDEVWDLTSKLREKIQSKTYTANIGLAMMKKYKDQEVILNKTLQVLKSGSPEYSRSQLCLTAVRYLITTTTAFQSPSKVDINFLKDNDAVDEIERAVFGIKTLDQAEDKIYTEMEPKLQEMQTKLSQLFDNMRTSNKLQLAVGEYDFKTIYSEIQQILEPIAKTLDKNTELTWAVENCKREFQLVFKLNELLIEYKDKMQDKIDTSNLHIAHASNLLVSNSELQYALSKLQVVMTSNVLVERYQEWLSDFKQFAFPYTGQVLKYFQNVDVFKHRSVIEVTREISKNITNHQYDISDDELGENRFIVNYEGSKSKRSDANSFMFVWKHIDFQKTIDDILSGNKGELIADVSKDSQDALKFNLVKILFTINQSNNMPLQIELNRLLNNFDVEITHTGTSTYKFRNKAYKCTNAPITFRSGYSQTSARILRNTQKASKGLCILSPYTTWLIKLIPINNADFNSFEKFKGNVNLELIGNAEYHINSDCDAACEETMENYYKVVDIKKI